MGKNSSVFKAKESFIIFLDLKQFLRVVGATLKRLGMRLHGDLIELLWSLDSEYMASLQASKTFSVDISTWWEAIPVKN